MPRSVLILLWVVAFFTGGSVTAETVPLEFRDLNGQLRSLRSSSAQKATVLFFILPDCPISNAYAPEIKRIASDYARHNIEAWIVYVDPDLSAEAARKHAKDFEFTVPLIMDRSLTLANQTGATIAPEVAVLAPDGKRLYLGRIDNLYAGYGKRRANPSQHDLRDALDAILQGKPVERDFTKAIGCFISKPVNKTKPAE